MPWCLLALQIIDDNFTFLRQSVSYWFAKNLQVVHFLKVDVYYSSFITKMKDLVNLRLISILANTFHPSIQSCTPQTNTRDSNQNNRRDNQAHIPK